MATLEQDYLLPPGQNFALVSFVGPECPQKNASMGMKLRGVFPTVSEAQEHAKRLQKSEVTSMDIYVMELGKWALIPPDPSKVRDQSFQEEKLADLMQGYRENQEKAKQAFYDRKDRIRKDGLEKESPEGVTLADIPQIVIGEKP